MSSVVACVPWVDTGCVHRARARDFVAEHWARLNVPVVYGITLPPPNRAAARNAASRSLDADVVFFCDADTWVPAEQFHQACERAAETGQMVLAYTRHLRLSKHATQGVLDGGDLIAQGQMVRGCCGGAFAVSTGLLREVGGHDERFTVWGCEDRCFQFACDTLTGRARPIDGYSYHLWHPKDPAVTSNTPERAANLELARRYKMAAGVVVRAGFLKTTKGARTDAEAMRAILAEPGGPLHREVARV